MAQLDPLALAAPIFIGAVFVERWVARRRGQGSSYHFGTAVSDIACGTTFQALELLLRIAVVGAYAYCYEHARLVQWDAASPWPWVVGFVGVDLAYYLWHRASHVVNALWAVHAVHHQSEGYNLAVALRQPLLEPLTWLPFFCVFAIIGIPVEIALVSFAANMFYQFWLHTELVRRLPAPLEWILNTPSHHRAHHGVEAEYLDKNYAGVLIIWDRLFGTFELERRPPTYGTTTPIRGFNPLWGNIEHWYRMAQLAAAARTWGDRLHTLIAHPAWLPDGVAKPTAGARPAKYRPSVAPRDLRWAIAWLAIVAVGSAAVMTLEANLGPAQLAIAFSVITTAFVSITAVLERRSWARQLSVATLLGTAVFVATVALQ